MTKGLITVFGGSGFLGKYVIRELVKEGWRIRVPVRRPHTAQELKVIGNVGQVQLVQANLRYEDSVKQAVAGSDAVINLVALLFEEGKQSFESLHVQGAATLAKAAAAQGISNFVQVSAIGADAESDSDYSRTKAEGEQAVRAAIPTADIMRPSIIFGAEDQFFNRFAAMAKISPVIPMVGADTKFQPVYVDDVAEAACVAATTDASGVYELGGPRTYTFRELMELMLSEILRRRLLAAVPFGVANIMAWVLSLVEVISLGLIKNRQITGDQVALLRHDNVVAEGAQTLADLGVSATAAEGVVGEYLYAYRPYGQYDAITESAANLKA